MGNAAALPKQGAIDIAGAVPEGCYEFGASVGENGNSRGDRKGQNTRRPHSAPARERTRQFQQGIQRKRKKIEEKKKKGMP